VVFTIPHELSWLALQNKKVIYGLLFRASAATLLEVAANAKHLGAQIGFLSVLHTWGQNLLHHPHVHCVIQAVVSRSTANTGFAFGMLFSSRESAEPSVSRQIHRRPEARLS